MPDPLSGFQRSFDNDENRTRIWDSKGNFVGYEPGNTEKLGNRFPLTQGDSIVPGMGIDPSVIRSNDGSIDWKKTAKNWAEDLIPAAITAAAPELRIPGLMKLSPIKQVLSKTAASAVAQTIADQLINGKDKSVLDSSMGAIGNSVLGIAIPELTPGIRNVGLDFPGMSRETRINRSNSGTSNTSGTSSTTSGPVMAPGKPVYQPGVGPQGQVLFGKMIPGPPEPTGQFASATTSNSTTGSSGIGNTNISRDINTPGMLGHILDLVKNIESFKTKSAIGLSDQQRAIKSALLGLGFNMAADTEKQ